MAGAVALAAGAVPNVPAGVLRNVYSANGVNDGNGLSLNLRAFMQGPNGQTYQLTDNRLPNFIRNSGFWLAQRQAPGTATTYSATAGRAISADGWGITNENLSATFRRVDTNGALETGMAGRYYGEVLKTTSTGKLVLTQIIEGVESQLLRNRTVRFTAMLKGGGGATPSMKLALLCLNGAGTMDTIPATFVSAFNSAGVDPTFGANISKCTGGFVDDGGSVMSGSVLTCATSAGWQRFSAAFLVPNDCKNLIPAIWTDGQPAAGAGFDIGQCSLTDGYEIQDWSPQSYEIEFARVRRFYQRSFAADASGPQTAIGFSTGESVGIAGKAGAVANAGIIPVRYITPMKSQTPTLTLFNPASANALMRDETGGADMGTTTTNSSSGLGFIVNATGVAPAVGNVVSIHWTSDGEL